MSVIVAMLAATVAFAGPASADHGYPHGRGPGVEVPTTTVVPGTSVAITFPGWMDKAPITVTVGEANGPKNSSLGLPAGTQARVIPAAFRLASTSCGVGSTCTLRTNAQGTAATNVRFARPGTYVITAQGRADDGTRHTASASLTVAAPAKARAAGLAGTGSDLTSLWAGIGLLLAGTLLVGVARSRRKVTI